VTPNPSLKPTANGRPRSSASTSSLPRGRPNVLVKLSLDHDRMFNY
jgi:hypothetical protein